MSLVGKNDKTVKENNDNYNGGLSESGKPVDYGTNAHDLNILEEKLVVGLDERYAEKLHGITQRLIDVSRKEKQSINHSAILLVVSKHLIVKEKYDVEVEHELKHDLGRDLVCDIYAYRPGDRTDIKIVEVETGFAGPTYALDTVGYLSDRAARKIYSYSPYSTKFFLGTPMYNVLDIPKIFLKPPESRTAEEIGYWNAQSAKYYNNPLLDFNNTKGHIEGIYVIKVDSGEVRQMDVNYYMKKYPLRFIFPSLPRF